MKAGEVFARISTHMVEGMMMHDQMADAYNFLTMPGFRALQEKRFMEETEAMRKLHLYYICHYNMLLEEGHPQDPRALPHSWQGYTRQQVATDTKRKAVRELMEHWVRWEKETKCCYQKAYADLMECGEVAAAQQVKQLICDVDEELAYAEMLHLRLEAVTYDMPTMDQMQAELE